METRTVPPDSASARQTEMGETFNRVLFSALDALQEHSIPYALIGGIAASGLGRPRSTHDIDVFVRPEDADAALEALALHGFETERTDRRWLYKGWKEEMMVDVIFKSSGDIYFDDEMHRRAKPIPYHGRDIPVISPEDLIIIKAAVHSEIGPHHWYDALAILSHATMDWRYLLKRSRRGPRRLLALLVYAQSNDILIPNEVIIELSQSIFGNHAVAPPSPAHAQQLHAEPHLRNASGKINSATSSQAANPDFYLLGHLQEALANDARTATLDVRFSLDGRKLLAKGEVNNGDQRDAVDKLICRIANGFDIENQIRVTEFTAPRVEEVV